MPAYAYTLLNAETGELLGEVTLATPVESRDMVRIVRRMVPERIAIGGTAKGVVERNNMLRAYHRKEEREGSRFKSAFTKQQIKEAWTGV